MPIGYTILFALMLSVVGVLLAGVFLMGKGGEANKKYSNKLMMMRVTLQGLALLVLALLFLMGNK